MYCRNCGKEIDDKAVVCPGCGVPTDNAKPAKKKSIFKCWWFWVIIVAVLFVSCVGSAGDSESEQTPDLPSASSTDEAPGESISANDDEITIMETVLYEADGIRITVKGIEDTFMGTDINLLVENDTAENIAVGCDDFIVNGAITTNGYLYIDVAAGKKANGTLSFYASELSAAGIEQIATVSTFGAYISNTDTYLKTKDIAFDIATSAASTYVQTIDDSGNVLYDQGGITVIAKNLSDDFWGGTVTVLIKNNSGADILAQAQNISVNGFTISTLHSDTICNGTVCFSEIDIYESYLEENGIEEIQEVTFSINFISPKTFYTIAQTNELRIAVGE